MVEMFLEYALEYSLEFFRNCAEKLHLEIALRNCIFKKI